ncbi:MAG: hypothetical protein H0X36_00305 [Sphingomonadaceae bacterium]|nr:hypothetical protein [Sphingomonadaceae bacterium]
MMSNAKALAHFRQFCEAQVNIVDQDSGLNVADLYRILALAERGAGLLTAPFERTRRTAP